MSTILGKDQATERGLKMEFVISAPAYIDQSPSGYNFRLRIPTDLKELVGSTEFRYSLRSWLLPVARQRARSSATFIHQLFIKVRSNMEEFTSEQITSLVRQYIKETLRNEEKCRSLAETPMKR